MASTRITCKLWSREWEPIPRPPLYESGALPTELSRRTQKLWSGWRDSNPRPPPWHGCILAAELHPPGWHGRIRTSAWEIQNLLPYQLGDIPKHTIPWMGDQDSNLGITDSESVALPAWLSPNLLTKLAPSEGFEPSVGALTVHCLTTWLTRNKNLHKKQNPLNLSGQGPTNL